MERFCLIFEDDGRGLDKAVEFEAEDAAGALLVMKRESRGRWTELWQGSDYLCSLRPELDGQWLVDCGPGTLMEKA